MKKTTTFKLGDSTISVESDDSQIAELIARMLVEKATAGMAPAPAHSSTGSFDLVRRLVEGCKENETQRGVLRALKKGWATRTQMKKSGGMDKADEKEGNKSLAGCRGSLGKRAVSLGLGRDWWTDAFSTEHKDFVATLREDVAEHLKKIDF
jgi:hypothetical protein